VTEVDDWQAAGSDGSRSGSLTVEIVGAPVRLTGSLRLTPDGAATVEAIEGDLKASVPMLGSKIEKATEPALLAAIRAEGRAGTSWLAED
jgi:hypothetical protein